jgi:hypothetical protein
VKLCDQLFARRPFEIDGIAQPLRDLNRALTLNLRIVRRQIRRPENGPAVSKPDWKSRNRLIACQCQQVQGGVQSINPGRIGIC